MRNKKLFSKSDLISILGHDFIVEYCRRGKDKFKNHKYGPSYETLNIEKNGEVHSILVFKLH